MHDLWYMYAPRFWIISTGETKRELVGKQITYIDIDRIVLARSMLFTSFLLVLHDKHYLFFFFFFLLFYRYLSNQLQQEIKNTNTVGPGQPKK
jgi:hypothetical protein